ncbi:hypothetical protein B0H14DRAFT_3531772 [Mycena olivaceomarginata]|nr:hypothetical protein B0H14DRAFT_3531772 [Mycena olivaceomarginata]
MTTTVSIYMSYYAPLHAPPRAIIFALPHLCAPDQRPRRDAFSAGHRLRLNAPCTRMRTWMVDAPHAPAPNPHLSPNSDARRTNTDTDTAAPARSRQPRAPPPRACLSLQQQVCPVLSICPSVRRRVVCALSNPAGHVHLLPAPAPAPAPAHLVPLLRAPGRGCWVMEWCPAACLYAPPQRVVHAR